MNPHFYHEARRGTDDAEDAAGHAGDVENDADDVDRLAQNKHISREHAVNCGIL